MIFETTHLWTDKSPAGNSRLASCGVTIVNSSAIFQFNFSAGLTVLCSETPHEHQAAKRNYSYQITQQDLQ